MSRVSRNLWGYFFIGGVIGPVIAALLNSFGLALSRPSFFLFIIFTLPVFVVVGFLPSGVLGMCTFFLIKIKEKPHPTLVMLLGAVYGFIVRFVSMFCFAKNKIPKDIFLDMFSDKANPAEWVPFLSNFWNTWIFIASGVLTCIVLQMILRKMDKESKKPLQPA